MNKKWTLALAGLVAMGVVAAAVTCASRDNDAGSATNTVLGLALDQPDAYLQSRQLSALPRDLVAMPGLREVLTQDFVLYYEEHPDRLTLEGTLKRLAFEHQLAWSDQAVAQLLDAPAQVALWRDGKGRLAYAAMLLDRNLAVQVLEPLARIALPDSQLSVVAQIAVGEASVKVFALKLHGRRTWLLASHGDHLLVLTDPGMLLDAQGKSTAAGQAMLARLLASGGRTWRDDFHLATSTARHSLALKASYLSFGYQHFFPGLQALQVEAGDNGWRVLAAANPSTWSNWPRSAAQAWSVLPRGAALCAALPTDWQRAQGVLTALPADKASTLVSDLEPGAGICWYRSSGLYAPVVALRFKPGRGAAHDEDLKLLLPYSLKKDTANPAELVVQPVPRGLLLTQDVASSYGYLQEGDVRTHRVALARVGDTLIASVDHRPVAQALTVAAKTYPALGDEASGAPLLFAQLPEVATMLDAERARLAAPGNATVFSRVSREQLKPRLDALGRLGRVSWRAESADPTPQSRPTPPQALDAGWVWRDLGVEAVPQIQNSQKGR